MKATEPNQIAFSREAFLPALDQVREWDMLVIGGGATGLGVAVDAASRGFRTLLLEQADFAKGTSSRSTKLVHGGVRYLAQGNVALVLEALQERGLLLQNAPHLVTVRSFVIPTYSWWNKVLYGVGLTVYDWLAGRSRLAKTRLLSSEKVAQMLPNIQKENLKGGVQYFDGQFDDARLALNLAQTCAEQGGTLLNYLQVVHLVKDPASRVIGVQARDLETGRDYRLAAKTVINATGVFVNEVLQMDEPAQPPLVRPSQGVHVVLDHSFLEGENALLIPETPDGRVLFVVPWHGHLLVGTTDTPLPHTSLEPLALDQEIDFILETAGQYLVRKPSRKDVLSVFAGLRPLAAPAKNTGSTKEISRSHKLLVSPSRLITITGGKWTTYRQMAEDTVDQAIAVGPLPDRFCVTAHLRIHGYAPVPATADHLALYGTDRRFIIALAASSPQGAQRLHDRFPHLAAQVLWAVRHEMARTVEDVLARRIGVLFLDARAALDMAPQVARLMATELGYPLAWQQKQLAHFSALASHYLLEPYTPTHPPAPTTAPRRPDQEAVGGPQGNPSN